MDSSYRIHIFLYLLNDNSFTKTQEKKGGGGGGDEKIL